MSEIDTGQVLSDFADALHRAVDDAEEAGVPLEDILRHMEVLSAAWRPSA